MSSTASTGNEVMASGVVGGGDTMDRAVSTPASTAAAVPIAVPLPTNTPTPSAPSSAPSTPSGHRRKLSLGQRLQQVVRKTSLGSPILQSPMSRTAPSPLPDDLYNLNVTLNVEDYELIKPVGFGASAVVYVAKFKPANREVAVKLIDLDRFERNQIEELRRELQIMTLSRDPNLLPVYGSFVEGHKLHIITPYCASGSCLDIIKNGFPDGLEEASIATILRSCLMGLAYLHRNKHIHRDVKAGNLLVDDDGRVLLADFGVSATLNDGTDRKAQRRTFVGTPCWMAPEVLSPERGYDERADIWSFGITALELANGEAPYAKYPPLKVLMLTLQHDPPRLDRSRAKHKYSKSFQQMIELCLQKDPHKRPTAEKLLEHPFFRQAKTPAYLAKTLLDHVPSPLSRVVKRHPHMTLDQRSTVTSWDFSTLEQCVISLSDDSSEGEAMSPDVGLAPPTGKVSPPLYKRSPLAAATSPSSSPRSPALRGVAASPAPGSRFKVDILSASSSSSAAAEGNAGIPSASGLDSPKRGRFELVGPGGGGGEQRRSVRFASSPPPPSSSTSGHSRSLSNSSNITGSSSSSELYESDYVMVETEELNRLMHEHRQQLSGAAQSQTFAALESRINALVKRLDDSQK